MRKSNEQSISEVIEQMLDKYKISGKMDEVHLVEIWEELMGKTIAKHTEKITIKNGKLILKLDSAVLKEELSYSKQKLMDMLNEALGKVSILEVVIR